MRAHGIRRTIRAAGAALTMTLAAGHVCQSQTLFVPNATTGIGTSETANVGVGTNTPGYKLEVNGTFGITNAGVISLGAEASPNNAQWRFALTNNDGNRKIRFYDAPGGVYARELLTIIGSTGNVGIGTFYPSDRLQVGSGLSLHDGGHKIIGFGWSPNSGQALMTGYPSEIRWNPTSGYLAFGIDGVSRTAGQSVTPTERMRISTGGHVGIGTAGADRPLVVSSGGNSLAAGEATLQVIGQTNKERIELRTFGGGNAPVFQGKTSGGTLGAPSATPSGAYLVALGGSGYDGTSFIVGNKGLVSIKSANAWTGTSQGAYINFEVTPIGSVTRAEAMRIDPSGKVGIGTTSPSHLLTVNGTIRAEEVIVEAGIAANEITIRPQGWADDVFTPGYALPTVDEVAAHIATEGHLPGVPSAATVADQGIALGEMQKTLLRKVEELTLYVIELKRENTELRTRTEQLEQRN